MHIRPILALFGFALVLTTAAGLDEKNLVQNPGFEEVKDGKPAHWATGGIAPGGKGSLAISTDKPHAGKHCARITGDAEWACFGGSRLPITRGKKYELRGFVRVAAGHGYIKFDYFKGTEYLGMTMDQPLDPSDWTEQRLTSETESHPTATHLVITLVGGNGAFDASFDDITVIEK